MPFTVSHLDVVDDDDDEVRQYEYNCGSNSIHILEHSIEKVAFVSDNCIHCDLLNQRCDLNRRCGGMGKVNFHSQKLTFKSSSYLILIGWLFLLSFYHPAVTAFDITDCDVLANGPSVFREFDRLYVECELTSKCVGCNVSDIFVKHNRIIYSTEQDGLYIRDNQSAVFMTNATMDMYGHFYCGIGDRDLFYFCGHVLHVTRVPKTPNITNCLVTSDWSVMRCDWLPTLKDQLNYTNSETFRHTLIVTNSEQPSLWTRCEPRQLTFRTTGDLERFRASTPSCEIDLTAIIGGSNTDKLVTLCVTVSATNVLNITANSTEQCIDLRTIVKPDIVRGLREEVNRTHVTLMWQTVTRSIHEASYLATIFYSDSRQMNIVNNVTVPDVGAVTLRLQPHSYYTWWVQLKPVIGGHASNISRRERFKTLSTVPCLKPQVKSGSFSISKAAPSGDRTVTIYWKPLQERDYCGPNFTYLVKYRPKDGLDSNWREIMSSVPFADLVLDGNMYEVEVFASNQMGSVMSDIPLIIPENKGSSLISYFTVEGERDTAMLNWTWPFYKGQGDKSVLYDDVSAISIFYCRATTPPCHTPEGIKWLTLSKSLTNTTMYMNESYEHFTYGISFSLKHTAMLRRRRETDVSLGNTLYLDTGILQWATCVYSIKGIAAVPSGVQVSAPKDSFGELHVSWKQFECSKGGSLVRHVSIYYCKTNHKAVTRPYNCSGDIYSRDVPVYVNTVYRLDGLEEGVRYNVWLRAVSSKGLSDISRIYAVETTQSWASKGVIVAMSFSFIVMFILLLAALCCIVKRCEKCRAKLVSGLGVVLPNAKRDKVQSQTSTAPVISETPNYNDTIRSFEQQISRLSNPSDDSSPLLKRPLSTCSPYSTLPRLTTTDDDYFHPTYLPPPPSSPDQENLPNGYARHCTPESEDGRALRQGVPLLGADIFHPLCSESFYDYEPSPLDLDDPYEAEGRMLDPTNMKLGSGGYIQSDEITGLEPSCVVPVMPSLPQPEKTTDNVEARSKRSDYSSADDLHMAECGDDDRQECECVFLPSNKNSSMVSYHNPQAFSSPYKPPSLPQNNATSVEADALESLSYRKPELSQNVGVKFLAGGGLVENTRTDDNMFDSDKTIGNPNYLCNGDDNIWQANSVTADPLVFKNNDSDNRELPRPISPTLRKSKDDLFSSPGVNNSPLKTTNSHTVLGTSYEKEGASMRPDRDRLDARDSSEYMDGNDIIFDTPSQSYSGGYVSHNDLAEPVRL